MAYYDVNAAIDKPNFLNSFRQGQQYGQQLREQKQQFQDQNALRTLAPQVIAGDTNAFSQAAAINPQAAQSFQGAGDSQLRRLKGAIDYIEKATASGNPQAAEAAYQQVRPYLNRNSPDGIEPPATLAEAMPKMLEAKARIAMLDQTVTQGRVQSTYVDGNGQRVAIMADGSQKVLGPNDAGMSNQTITITGPDGRPAQYTFNKRTASYEPASLGGGQPPGTPAPAMDGQPVTQFTGSDGQPIRIGNDIDPALRQDLIANAGTYESLPDGAQAQLPPVSRGLSPFVGQSPAEEAAAVAAAKLQAENQNFDQRFAQESAITGMKTQAEVDAARQKAEQTTAAERSTTRMEKEATLRVYEAAVQGLQEGLANTETGPLVGRLPAFTAEQQIAEGGVAAMAPILKQLFRTAGEGTFTDKDQELLLAMVPTRQDLPASRASKLANIDRIVRAKLASPSGGASPTQAAPVRRARNPQTGAVVVLRDGQWVPE